MMTDREVVDLVQSLLPADGKVLDVGCGNGSTLAVLAERGAAGVGVDPYPYGKAAPCRRLRAEEISSLQERFDLIYTVYALHHFNDPQQFLQEAKQVLTPVGVLLIVDWVERAHTGVRERYFSLKKVTRWVTEAGFELLRQQVRGQTMVVVGRSSFADRQAG